MSLHGFFKDIETFTPKKKESIITLGFNNTKSTKYISVYRNANTPTKMTLGLGGDLCDIIGVKEGDQVMVQTDPHNPKEFMLMKGVGPKLKRTSKSNGGGVIVNFKPILLIEKKARLHHEIRNGNLYFRIPETVAVPNPVYF